MLVLDYLLISNGPQDGSVLMGTFTPAKGDEASKLNLIFPNSEIEIKGDEASLLFDYYVNKGTRIGPAQYATISGDAIRTLTEFFERIKGDYISERRSEAEACRAILKTLQDRTHRN